MKLINTEVIFNPEICYIYSSDCSAIKGIPWAVALVSDLDELEIILKFCYKNNIPVSFRGGGTSLRGSFVLRKGGLLISLNSANKIIKFDKVKKVVYAETGATISQINNFLKKDNYYLPLFSTNKLATVGGIVSNNAKNYRVFDNSITSFVKGLRYIDISGNEVKSGVYTKSNSLGNLVLSAEGTLAVVREVALSVLDVPIIEYLVFLIIPNFKIVNDLVKELNANNLTPIEALLRDSNFWLKNSSDIDFFQSDLRKGLVKNKQSYGLFLKYHFSNYPDYYNLNKILFKIVASKFKEIQIIENKLSLNNKADILYNVQRISKLNNYYEYDISISPKDCTKFLEDFNTLISNKSNGLKYYLEMNPFTFMISIIVYTKNLNAKSKNFIKFFSEDFYKLLANFECSLSVKLGIGLVNSRFLTSKLSKNKYKLYRNVKDCFDEKNLINSEKIIKRMK